MSVHLWWKRIGSLRSARDGKQTTGINCYTRQERMQSSDFAHWQAASASNRSAAVAIVTIDWRIPSALPQAVVRNSAGFAFASSTNSAMENPSFLATTTMFNRLVADEP